MTIGFEIPSLKTWMNANTIAGEYENIKTTRRGLTMLTVSGLYNMFATSQWYDLDTIGVTNVQVDLDD